MSSLRDDTVKTFEGNISVAFPSGIWTRWKVNSMEPATGWRFMDCSIRATVSTVKSREAPRWSPSKAFTFPPTCGDDLQVWNTLQKTNGFYLGKRKIIFNNLQWCLGRGDVSCQEVINPLLPDGFIVFSLLFGFVLLEFAVKSLSSVICLKNTSESSTHLKALVEIGNLSYGWK